MTLVNNPIGTGIASIHMQPETDDDMPVVASSFKITSSVRQLHYFTADVAWHAGTVEFGMQSGSAISIDSGGLVNDSLFRQVSNRKGTKRIDWKAASASTMFNLEFGSRVVGDSRPCD